MACLATFGEWMSSWSSGNNQVTCYIYTKLSMYSGGVRLSPASTSL